MKRIRLSTMMLLIVIVALGIALLLQQDRFSRREAELQRRLAQSWPLFLKQQRQDEQLRYQVEIMQRKYRAELAKQSPAEAERQRREDEDVNRQIEAMQKRFRDDKAREELQRETQRESEAPRRRKGSDARGPSMN